MKKYIVETDLDLSCVIAFTGAGGVIFKPHGELIMCTDCKYYIADGCDECVLMNAKSIIAGINNKRWYSDFYCAWAERKEKDGK